MDRKLRNKATLKLFEDSLSEEDTPDPYSDDGECGSDQDYDPEPAGSSESDNSVVDARPSKATTSKIESSVSGDSDSSACSSSSDSIFGTRARRKQTPTSVNRRRIASDCSSNTAEADTISLESLPGLPLAANLENGVPNASPSPVQMENIPTPPISPQAIERDAQLVPLSSPPVCQVNSDDIPESSTPPPPQVPENVQNDSISATFPLVPEIGQYLNSSPFSIRAFAEVQSETPSMVEEEIAAVENDIQLGPSPSPAKEHLPTPSPLPPPAEIDSHSPRSRSPPQVDAVDSQPPTYPPPSGNRRPPHVSRSHTRESPKVRPRRPRQRTPSPRSRTPPQVDADDSQPPTYPSPSGNRRSPHVSRSHTRESRTIRPRRPRQRTPSPRSRSPPQVDAEGSQPPTYPPPSGNRRSPHVSRSNTREPPAVRPRRPRHRTSSPVAEWEISTADIPTFEFDSSSQGIQFEMAQNALPADVFNKMFPAHIVDHIVTSTNEYGRTLCATNRPTTRNSRRYRYKDTDREEILKFLGLCLLMGQVNVPKKKKLFTYTDPLYYHPIFQYTMSARRFEQILRCLCVSERGAKGKDKIIKFIDAVVKVFRECYKPEKELSLDESMLLFRGRLSFRQFIKSKKAKYGIKFYELTTSDGYVLNISMYAGKDEDNENETRSKTEKLVMRLMRPFLLKGHHLFMDNYYNSVTLSQKLLDLKTHTVGTLRTNRKDNPKDLTMKKLKKNEHFWVRKNKVYVSKWHDKRSVLMLTTLNHPKLVEVSNRRGQKRMKPLEVSTYNQFMSGIDRADQMVSYYSTPRKTLRWYKKVFFHLLDLAVWNSFYVYKKYCKNNSRAYEFKTFRKDLIKKLIKLPQNLIPEEMVKRNRFDNRLKERENFIQPANLENIQNSGHWPEKIPIRESSKKASCYLKCKMCSKNKIRRETSLRCKGCEAKPALCAICFQAWHTQTE